MLTEREKTQKLIEIQLADLSDQNIQYLYKEMMSFLQGQKRRELAREYLNRETILSTSVVCEGARIEVKKQKMPKMPVMKQKRPRIQKVEVDTTIKIVLPDNSAWVQGHMEGLREMYNNHVTQ